MDTVRTDDEVVRACRAVGEAHPLLLTVVLEIGHRQAESERNLDAPRAEGLVQRRSANRNTGSDTVPVLVNVDVGEPAATVVENALPHDRVRTSSQLRPDPELVERPDAVARQVQAGAARLPLGHALDDIGRSAALVQSAGKRQTADTGTDDQHARRHGGWASSRSRAANVLWNARRIPRSSSNRSKRPAIPPRGWYSTTSR